MMMWWLLLTPWVGGVLLLSSLGRAASAPAVAAGIALSMAGADALVLDTVLSAGPFGGVAGGWPEGVGIRLEVDALGAVFALTASVVVAVALASRAARPGFRWLGGPALLALAGLHGLFFTRDVFSFYVFFELSMMASFALAAAGDGARRLRTALVFAAVNLLGSAFFLAGIVGLYRTSGTLDMTTISAVLAERPGPDGLLFATLFFIAFALKLGLFPFHTWAPALYVDADPAASTILAGAVANIGAYGLLRFAFGVFPDEAVYARNVLLVWAGLSVVYGGIVAVGRAETRLTLAYASISQAGFILLGIALADLMAATLFAVVDALHKALGFLAAPARGPVARGAFLVAALSFVGLPLTPGFFAKLGMARAAWEQGSWVAVVILFVGAALLLAALTATPRFRDRGDPPDPAAAGAHRAALAVFAAIVVILGVFAGPLVGAVEVAAMAAETRP